MKKKFVIFLYYSVLSVVFIACQSENNIVEEIAEWDKTPYSINAANFPPPIIQNDNPLTIQGVKLGRMLFYEKKLSKDNSQSCGDCHQQKFAFTDTNKFSIGVRGLPGKRTSMSVFNMAWNRNRFFWDGRAELLRHQSLMPIQDELEMDETLANVVKKISADKIYRNQFMRAFGSEEVNAEKISFALEQFMLSIVSNNSKYDKFLAGSVQLSESEERGRKLFFKEYNPNFPNGSGADCAHCHGSVNFNNDRFFNNGISSENEIIDIGFEKVTSNQNDKGKFKTVSLRNIALTAPYMHNGKFQTLMEVLNHYDHDLQQSSTLDPALEYTRSTGLKLSQQDKIDIIEFLKTLSDETLLSNQEYSNPFSK